MKSSTFAGVSFSSSLALLGIAVAVESNEIWFALVYLSSLATVSSCIVGWLLSNFLRKNNPSTWTRSRQKRVTRWIRIRFQIFKWGVPTILVAVMIVCVWETQSLQDQIELSKLNGRLYPDNESIPTHPCWHVTTRDSLLLFLGSAVGIADRFPAIVYLLNHEKVITLDRNQDGSLALSLILRSPDKRVVVSIDRGNFVINRNNFFTVNRRDRSSLEVVDQNGNSVLNLKFFNPRALWLNAEMPGMSFKGSLMNSKEAFCISAPHGGPVLAINIPDEKMLSWWKGSFGPFFNK